MLPEPAHCNPLRKQQEIKKKRFPISSADPQTQRLFEPTLQFVQKQLTGGEDGEAKLLVPELVLADQVLADYPGFERFESKGYCRGPIMAGPNTRFAENGSALLSTVIGYPKIRTLENDDGTSVPVISVTPLIKYSFDKLSASLFFYPTLKDAHSLTEDNLEQLIEAAGLKYGIDQAALDMAKDILREGHLETSELVIARGTLPGTGTDAFLEFAIEIGPIAGLIDEYGRIDFRERRIMVAVEENQLIATKVPAIPGSPGQNVLGEVIEPKNGRDIKVKNYGDSSFSSDTLEVRATKGGALSVVNRTIIKVSSRQLINSDVDFNTGNLESNGCLSIKGSIQPGFKVNCAGDLEIGGSVMSAQIRGESNAVIRGGITGKNSTVSVQGDADIRFIEQGELSCGGIIVIRIQSYFSRVTSRSDIRCHPDSIVMGGSLTAAGYLTVGTVGTESSDPAILGAGIDPERLAQLSSLRKTLKEQQNEVISWLQMHGGRRSRKLKKMEAAVDETKLQILKLNLIPGTEIFSRWGTGSSREEIDEINPLYHQGIDVDEIRIEVHGTAYPGTELLLGNRSLTLEKAVSKRMFKLSSDMKRIIALPLRTKGAVRNEKTNGEEIEGAPSDTPSSP